MPTRLAQNPRRIGLASDLLDDAPMPTECEWLRWSFEPILSKHLGRSIFSIEGASQFTGVEDLAFEFKNLERRTAHVTESRQLTFLCHNALSATSVHVIVPSRTELELSINGQFVRQPKIRFCERPDVRLALGVDRCNGVKP